MALLEKVAVLLLLGVAVFVAANEEVVEGRLTFDGHQVLRINPQSEADLLQLRTLRNNLTIGLKLDWWIDPSFVGQPVDIRVPPQSRPLLELFLRRHGMSYSVKISDVGSLVAEQYATAQPFIGAEAFDFGQYHTLDDINAWVQTLPRLYPGLATVFQVATSYEKRPIYAVKITNTSVPGTKIGFWFDGGIHSREWIAPATVIYMLNELLTQYGKDATVTSLVNSLDIYVVPVFNVDGYVYTWTTDRMWRKTRSNTGHVCIGVDPNRNWDFHWGEEGASSNPCDDAYYGPSAFSEIEVKSVANYIRAQTNINAYLNFHSYSQLWMSPWGYSAAKPKDYTVQNELSAKSVAALTKVHGTQYQYGPIYTTIYVASGNSADWTYGVANVVFSYGIELRDTGRYGFLLPADQIIPTGEETFEGVKVAMQYVIDHPRPSA